MPRAFEVAVIGHLREVKDPLRAARACGPVARHIAPVDRASGRRGECQMGGPGPQRDETKYSRYVWRGEVTGGEVRRMLGRVQAIVLSSISEGGANVLAEAVMAGVPVLASRIDAAVAQLGRDYPGFFPVQFAATSCRKFKSTSRTRTH